ncbi:alpha/beta fold hydrolase [Massilia sp. UYP11]|uniref:alpha/beta fold hydrolase n=1 Tax=Massilia sp. UYP11 TaxID=1756385 RepID=UPI003D1D5641
MPTLHANGLRIAFDTAGDAKAAPLLLIHGLGMQLTNWPDEFVEGLVELGFYVIRFDHRDSGLSTKFEQAGTPNLALARVKAALGWPPRSPYGIDDMAADALGVLSALGVARAHLVGVSALGGMVAQQLAARHPQRLLTLTSIMSTSGRRALPGPSATVRKALASGPADPADLDSLINHAVGQLRLLGSPSYPTPDRQLRKRVTRSMRRCYCPGGSARQMLALLAAGDRSALLPAIAAPTLVIHGAADPLLPAACGQDVARRIEGARLEIIEGMGHDLPPQLVERILALIDSHARGKMLPNSTPRLFVKQ